MGKANGLSEKGSGLTSAAAALDVELRRYVELTAAAVRVPLTSEKNLERAARALEEAAASDKRVLEHVQSLVQAVSVAREAQQSSAATLNARVTAIQERRAELEPLLAQLAKLGDAAKTMNAALQKVAGYKQNPYGSEEAAEMRQALVDIEAGMLACAGHAQELATEAMKRDFEELGRQADSLRQAILAAKNRLSLLQKGTES
jgi:hypothetical protein